MMKKFNYALVGLLGSALLFSCGESMKKVKEAKEGFEAVSELAKAGSGVAKDMKKLSELDPWSHQDFEKWAPNESFQGMKRTELELGEGIAEASIKIFYLADEGSKKMEIYVVDGADKGGGNMLIAQLNMFLNADISKVNESNNGQIVEKNGVRAMVHSDSEYATIETIANERFYVKVAGIGMDSDAVWDAFKALKTDKLK